MCDDITTPDGKTIDSVRPDGMCLCNTTDDEIKDWLRTHFPDEPIYRDATGWYIGKQWTDEAMEKFGIKEVDMTEKKVGD